MGSSLSRIFWSAPDYDDSDNNPAPEPELEPELTLLPERRYTHELPLGRVDAASADVTQMERAELSIEGKTLVLRWPRHSKGRPQWQCWPLEQDLTTLAAGVRALMAEDGVKRLTAAEELCARYPGYFWNLALHFAKNPTPLYDFIAREFSPPTPHT